MDDVLTLLATRAIPESLYVAVRVRIEDRHGRPYGYQVRAWCRLLETFPEWDDADFMAPDWVLTELRMQEGLSGNARQVQHRVQP